MLFNLKLEPVMQKYLISTALATIITVTALYASADSDMKKEHGKTHKEKGGMIKMMDSDKDGKVTESEFMSSSKERFGKIDADNDGSVTKEEIESHHKDMKEKHEMKKKEMSAKRDERFGKMDSDGDGSISKEEMDKFHESKKGKKHKAEDKY